MSRISAPVKLAAAMRVFLSTAGCALLLFTGSIDAAIIGLVTTNPDGTFTYTYSVDNSSGSFAISAFSLDFDIPGDELDFDRTDVAGGGDIVVPNPDWLAFETPFSVAEAGLDVVNLFGTPVAIGETLSGFSFQTRFPPVPTTMYVEFSSTGDSATGLTVGPAIPEISTVLLMYFGLGIVVFSRRRRTSRPGRLAD